MKNSLFLASILLTSASPVIAEIGDVVNFNGKTAYSIDGITVQSYGVGYGSSATAKPTNSTRFYDSSKSAPWTTPYKDGTEGDSNMCWTHAASNSIQYWQDVYGVFCKNEHNTSLPNGYYSTTILPDNSTDIHLNDVSGAVVNNSKELNVAKSFYENWTNEGGDFSYATEWYFKGKNISPDSAYPEYYPQYEGKRVRPNSGGYFADYFEGIDSYISVSYNNLGVQATNNSFSSLTDLKMTFIEAFGFEQQADGSYIQTEEGLMPSVSLHNPTSNTGHVYSCQGFTTDANGNLVSILIADGDNGPDAPAALKELYVKQDNTGKIFLYNRTNSSGHIGYYIDGISYINTPQVLQNMLAEYRDINEAAIWNGGSEEWSTQIDVVDSEIADISTGWDIYVDSSTGKDIDTKHHGYYHGYALEGRKVKFDNHAAEDKRTVTINGTVAASSIEIAAKDYVFQAGNNAAIKEGADMTVRSGASLESGVQLTLKNLTLEAGAGLQATAPIVVTGAFTASTAGQTRTTDTPQANVHSVLDLSQADSLTMQAIVNMNGNDLYLSAEPLKIFINPADAGKAEIVCFTGIGNLYLENRNTENYCLKADVSYVGLDPETLLQYQLMYNQQLRTLTLVQSVPEPTTATLSLLALAALVGRRRRR